MKLAAIYARVSTARQEEEQTIKTQMVADIELIEKRGLKLVTEYTDEGWSGDILARPALDKLRQDAKLKQWEVLVVYDPDRLARRYSYQELIMDELREAGIEVAFVTVPAPKNSEEKILHGVRGLFSEYERAKIGERFRLGKLRKIKEGHLLVSEPLYGYRYIPKHDKVHGYYEIHPDESRVMKMIFDWIDQDGLTIRGVIKKLHDLKIPPRKSSRGVWATSTLSKLLKNRAYIGEAHWGSSYAVVPQKPISTEKYRKIRKSSRRTKPEAEWFTVPVPAIIQRDVFERVRRRIEYNFQQSQRHTKNKYLLAGRIYCTCGRKRAGEGVLRGKHLYYRCTDRVLSYPLPHKCHEPPLHARIVDQRVWNEITTLMSSPRRMRSQVNRWLIGRNVPEDTSESEMGRLKSEITSFKNQEDRYNQAYGAGAFTVEQLRQYTLPLREKVSALEARFARLKEVQRESEPVSLPAEDEIKTFAKESTRTLRKLDFDGQKVIVGKVVNRVIGTRQKLQIYGFIPVNIKKHVELCPSDRDGGNTIRHGVSSEPPKQIPFYIELDTSLSNN